MAKYKYKLEEDVTVQPVGKNNGGRSKDGVVSKRMLAQGSYTTDTPLYTILYNDDSAETLVHEHRIHPRDQLPL